MSIYTSSLTTAIQLAEQQLEDAIQQGNKELINWVRPQLNTLKLQLQIMEGINNEKNSNQ